MIAMTIMMTSHSANQESSRLLNLTIPLSLGKGGPAIWFENLTAEIWKIVSIKITDPLHPFNALEQKKGALSNKTNNTN